MHALIQNQFSSEKLKLLRELYQELNQFDLSKIKSMINLSSYRNQTQKKVHRLSKLIQKDIKNGMASPSELLHQQVFDKRLGEMNQAIEVQSKS